MAGRLALGLRMQIVVALSVALALAFVLLGAVALRLAERSSAHARDAHARAAANTLALRLAAGELTRERFDELAEASSEPGAVAGITLEQQGAPRFTSGVPGHGVRATAEVAPGARLSLWVTRDASGFDRNLKSLFVLYAILTGGAILLFAYAMLTY
ncbi:MAG: hypothetical protein H5U40_15290, partial [Polyangiaceae bacterium]|nr:hypothetical protein [Polyangiaceae bacterium]